MGRKQIILIAGLLIAAVVIFTQVRSLMTPAPVVEPVVTAPVAAAPEIEYVDVLVSTMEIPFGSRLNVDHFMWDQWPAEAVNANLIWKSQSGEIPELDNIMTEPRPQAIEDLTGGVARSVIFEGEPISERKIVMPGAQGLMATILKPGMRAVTTRISVDTAAGGFVQPGDHVDVILTTAITDNLQSGFGNSTTQYMAETIFENVRVLAIDQTFSSNSDAGAAVIGSTATFEMTQQDAELLQQAVAQGDLTLTLRPMVGSYSSAGKSTASIKGNKQQSTLTVIRNGQSQIVAIRE